jgi:hypothetical protein
MAWCRQIAKESIEIAKIEVKKPKLAGIRTAS